MSRELEGLGVIRVNGEDIDLQFLVCVGDVAFEEELRRMTKRFVTKEDLITFLGEIEGRWSSSRNRRKEVDAASIVKALPGGWKILLALRLRVCARIPSLYCRAFISPSGEQFKTCRDAAFYLRRAHLGTAVCYPPKEGEVRPEQSGHQLVDEVAGELHEVPVLQLVKCSPCGILFNDISDLEHHLGQHHWETTRRFDFRNPTGEGSISDDLTAQTATPDDLPQEVSIIDDLQMVERSVAQTSRAAEKEPGLIWTTCSWCCSTGFFCETPSEGIDKDTGGLLCPSCEANFPRAAEGTLSIQDND